MQTAPNYRVLLTEHKRLKSLEKNHPSGLPCTDFRKVFAFADVKYTLAYIVDKSQFEQWELTLLSECLCNSKPVYLEDGKRVDYWIPQEKVLKVTDINQPCLTDNVLDECFLMVENASKLKNLTLQVDGNAIHLLIIGIQQALFIEPQKDLSINDLILPMAVDLIKRLTKDDEALKKAYLTGFPCEYIVKARELLFPYT